MQILTVSLQLRLWSWVRLVLKDQVLETDCLGASPLTSCVTSGSILKNIHTCL